MFPDGGAARLSEASRDDHGALSSAVKIAIYQYL